MKWRARGLILNRETIASGLDNAPAAFIYILSGVNTTSAGRTHQERVPAVAAHAALKLPRRRLRMAGRVARRSLGRHGDQKAPTASPSVAAKTTPMTGIITLTTKMSL